jgi:hypothetical protein
MSDPSGVRYVSVRFAIGSDEYYFEEIQGDDVIARPWDGSQYGTPVVLSLFDVWRSRPHIRQFWEGAECKFDTWGAYAKEQTWRLKLIGYRLRRLWDRARGSADVFRKEVSIERFLVLQAVSRLQRRKGDVSPSQVADHLLGQRWAQHEVMIEKFAQIQSMLDALCELNELKPSNYRYKVTGQGIAALSQYEEEERKHRETLGLQRRIAMLTIIMAIAALLQAKVVDFDPLVKISWPWK